jgi:hypothetical protein
MDESDKIQQSFRICEQMFFERTKIGKLTRMNFRVSMGVGFGFQTSVINYDKRSWDGYSHNFIFNEAQVLRDRVLFDIVKKYLENHESQR